MCRWQLVSQIEHYLYDNASINVFWYISDKYATEVISQPLLFVELNFIIMEKKLHPFTREINVSFDCKCGQRVYKMNLELPSPAGGDVNSNDETSDSDDVEYPCGYKHIIYLYKSTTCATVIIETGTNLIVESVSEDS